jgi:hypothetical protein
LKQIAIRHRDSTAAPAVRDRETQKGEAHELSILPLADCFGTTHYSVRRKGTAECAASIRSKAGDIHNKSAFWNGTV